MSRYKTILFTWYEQFCSNRNHQDSLIVGFPELVLFLQTFFINFCWKLHLLLMNSTRSDDRVKLLVNALLPRLSWTRRNVWRSGSGGASSCPPSWPSSWASPGCSSCGCSSSSSVARWVSSGGQDQPAITSAHDVHIFPIQNCKYLTSI